MIDARRFLAEARALGFTLASGVPCSWLAPLIDAAAASPEVRYVAAANEGDAVAIASGAVLGGRRAFVLLQSSGLGNAVSPLTSLCPVFRLPVLLIVTWRGEPGGPADEPQHALAGRITPALLEVMGIRWERFPQDERELSAVLGRAVAHMDREGASVALIAGKDDVAPYPSAVAAATSEVAVAALPAGAWPAARPSRRDVVAAIQARARPTDVLIATTGYAGRELLADGADRPNRLAMVGSMGCVSSLALGLAATRPERRVVAIDGDGAALMRLGALATIGCERPPNLVHVMLDNEAHASTGGQPTAAAAMDLAAVAQACGYPVVRRIASAAALGEALAAAADVLTFLHVKMAPDAGTVPPRPTVAPAAAARRLRDWLQESAG